jgi:hypothetical protein
LVEKGLSLSFLLVVVVAAVILAAVTPVSSGGTGYTYSSPSSGVVNVSASSLTSGNDREFFYSATGNTYADSSACETTSGTPPAQPGIAFRITDSHNVITAVTVTENIFGSPSSSAYNDFNVHIWDTSQTPAFSLVGHAIIKAISSSPQPEPLNLCAEITNDVVQFVTWTSGPQPAWGDPTWGGSVTLPSNAPTRGQTGYFAGHIPAGTSAIYSNLTVDGAAASPLSCCMSVQFGSFPTA